MKPLTLATIAQTLGGILRGDADLEITGLATLKDATSTDLSFLANPAYLSDLPKTRAGCVLLKEAHAHLCPTAILTVDDPYLAYARISHAFTPQTIHEYAGIHPTAVISTSAQVADTAIIGPHVTIGPNTKIYDSVRIDAHTVVGANCEIGAHTHIFPQVTVYHGVVIGERVRIHSGSVIGADGFGFAPDAGKWHRIAQLGGVTIADDVDIGACTTIDRGALSDTLIESGVIIDNHVQIAHNCVIGEGTAIAGCVGIAGSARIGKGCTIAGQAGIAGHVEIADGVHIGMQAQVTRSIDKSGAYASGTGLMPAAQWRKMVGRLRRLDKYFSFGRKDFNGTN